MPNRDDVSEELGVPRRFRRLHGSTRSRARLQELSHKTYSRARKPKRRISPKLVLKTRWKDLRHTRSRVTADPARDEDLREMTFAQRPACPAVPSWRVSIPRYRSGGDRLVVGLLISSLPDRRAIRG